MPFNHSHQWLEYDLMSVPEQSEQTILPWNISTQPNTKQQMKAYSVSGLIAVTNISPSYSPGCCPQGTFSETHTAVVSLYK